MRFQAGPHEAASVHEWLHPLQSSHSYFDDTDLMLCWRGADGLPTKADIPATDRWLAKACRAAKVRANGMDPIPEPDG